MPTAHPLAGQIAGTTPSDPDIMSERILDLLQARPGVRALAVIGSRAGADPTRIDRYSDLDVLVCCDDDERAALIDASWINEIREPVLVFPRIMDDEVRILFDDLFDCEVHIIPTGIAREMSGPCRLGSYAASGFRIVHDPEGIFSDLISRITLETPEERNPEYSSSVFWYNAAFCANMILRGDHYRAAHLCHWYLQYWLLELLFDMDGDGTEKFVHRKLDPEQYAAFSATIGPLTTEGMKDGLRAAFRCYWMFQKSGAPDIDPSMLDRYRRIEADILRRFAE